MQPEPALLRFLGDLADLARATPTGGRVAVPVAGGRAVKDAVESCGVPHTEVGRIVVDGRPVSFAHPLTPGSRVAVHPVEMVDRMDPRLRPPPLGHARFVCDVHLGRLAQLLRLLGFDTAYDPERDDPDLARCSAAERRWLLTRDRGLLMRRIVAHGQLLRSDNPRAQLREVVRRHRLAGALAPRTRCARCNAVLAPVDKAAIVDRLEPGTRAAHDVFARCTACGQLYWEGSHAPALDALVAEARGLGDESGGASR